MYNIAFIGGGVNSAIGRSHYIAAQMDGKFKLVAGAFSRHAEINQETGESFGVFSEHVYDDYKMMLEREKDAVDVIAVLTPTDTHEQIVCDCLQAGYPVICEKSLSTSLQSALQVQKVLDEMRGFLCVTYNYTGYPMVRVLREKIQAKELGKITNIIIEMPQEGFSRYTLEHTEPKPQEWRMKDYQIPTISLDLGTHLHNMIAFLTGEHPIEVVGREDSFGFFPQKLPSNSIIVVKKGDYTWNGSEEGGIIVATGNVKLEKNFKGLIIAGGDIEFSGATKVVADSDRLEKIFDNDTIIYNMFSKYFRKTIASSIAKDDSSGDNGICYENWKKN